MALFSSNTNPSDSYGTYRDTEPTSPLKAVLLGATLLAGASALAWKPIANHFHPDPPLPGAGQCMVVLVDFTDPPTADQLATLRVSVQERIARMPVGACIGLYRLPGDQAQNSDLVETVFATIKPRTGEHADPVTENKRMLEDAYENGFLAPLQAALERLKSPAPSDTTPLVEALHALGKDPQIAAANRWHLDYWGDGLQHSAVISHLRGEYDIDTLAGSTYLEDMTALRQATVTLHRMQAAEPRHRKHQPQSKDFWQDYFDALRVVDYNLETL